MSHVRTNSSDETRQHIISSLFARKGPDGAPEETLITFLKVFEEDEGPGGSKTRYLMLAVTKGGKVVIHKAKRNNNLSFSKGKTWNLEDMRTVEVMGPNDFSLTMTVRTYHWTTERPRDQTHFLNSAIKVYQKYTNGELPQLVNFTFTPGSTDDRRPSSASSSNSPFVRNGDLVPPPSLRNVRSGSSSSLNSAVSSSYAQSQPYSPISAHEPLPPIRPQIDDSRPSLGRSPLAESSFSASGRRPAPPSSLRNAGPSGPSGPSTTLAPPSSMRPSVDRPGDGLRKASGTSDYGDATSAIGGMMRGSSHDESAIIDDDAPPSKVEIKSPIKVNGDSSARPSPLKPPAITTTLPSPSIPVPPEPPEPSPLDRRPQRRKSFHPAPVNTAFSREVLLASRTGLLPGAAGLTVDGDKDQADGALLSNVEEMLEDFDWTAGAGQQANGNGVTERTKGSADAIEKRLLDELAALDQANIHAFLESDDRIAQVLGHIDEALTELDDIDSQLTGYRVQLDAVSDDISFIESQNRGLQVQTSNQQALLDELRQLLQIAEVPPGDLRTLAQESPQSQRGVEALERAAASLYKALQAGRDQANAEVAATLSRMQEYQAQSAQFCKRILDYLDMTFKYQADNTLAEVRKTAKKPIQLSPHTSMGEHLMMYEGLVLYLKEMDEDRYRKLCSDYMGTISSLHSSEIKDMLMSYMQTIVASATGDPSDALFASTANTSGARSNATNALAKSRAVIGLKPGDTTNKAVRKGDDNSGRIAELYQQALTNIVNQVLNEEGFIGAFLHLTDTESTFADHMELESYFRRQAARHAARQMSMGMMQLIRSMMDLIFGFIDLELKNWVEAAAEKNPVAIVGIIAVTERLAQEAEAENTSTFFSQLFDRQIARQRVNFDLLINNQLKAIDSGRMTRRRREVAPSVKQLPAFVERIESQMQDTLGLPIRAKVNEAYERIVNAIFATIQHIAKMDRAEAQAAEDKGQLNYNVILIENMHHFVEDIGQLNNPALAVYLERARGMYDDNMSTYVKMMLRRNFGRLMDFFDGVEHLLSSGSPASEVSMHNAYSRSNLKKVLKDTGGSKDLRKAIEAMSKRVDKHFADDESPSSLDASTRALISTVWRELSLGLKGEVAKATEMIKASYGDSGLSLEYTVSEVEGICKRTR